MRIYAIGGAGYKGAVILGGVDGERIHLIRKDYQNLVDLIGIGLIENLDYEGVTKGEAVKVGEELGRGQTTVPGKDGMTASAADREGGALDMTDSYLEHGFIGSVIDGERAADDGDFDIAEDAVAGDIEKRFILGAFLVGHGISILFLNEGLIIGVGGFKKLVIFIIIHIGNFFGIDGDCPCLVEGIPIIADRGIKHQSQTGKKSEEEQRCSIMPFLGSGLSGIAFFLH